ncbi:UNVERIFIED_CONTAM: hypothetical protein FKN15_031932 [Acipenser sinensis]
MWLQDKEEAVKEDKKMKIKRLPSPSPDEDIKQITKEFCEWVASLGGESNNLDESTLMSLFGSGYESKPALTVPIQVVELTNVPAELRMAVGEFRPPTDTKSQFEKDGEIPMFNRDILTDFLKHKNEYLVRSDNKTFRRLL